METRISVTEAARNLADVLNRVRYRQEGFILMRGGKAFARILPHHEEVTAGDLAERWASLPRLGKEEAKGFAEDMRAVKKKQGRPKDPWG